MSMRVLKEIEVMSIIWHYEIGWQHGYTVVPYTGAIFLYIGIKNFAGYFENNRID